MAANPETTKALINSQSTAEMPSTADGIDPLADPEPLPDWEVALTEWKALWEVHFVGFALLFIAMAFFSCFCVVRIRQRSKLMTLGNYFFVVCLMLMLFSLSRALFLALDPYESHTVLDLPVLVVRILFAIGYPCLTSSLSLIHFAFLEVNKLELISRRLQNIKFLVSVIATHFIVVFIIYVIITLSPKLARLLILCQTIQIVWWIVLAICFLYSGWKVNLEWRNSIKFFQRTTKDRAYSTDSASTLNKASQHGHNNENQPPRGAQKIARISGLVVLLSLFYVGLELYSLFSLYKLYDLEGEGTVDHWSWWGYQTCGRALDFLLCLVIAYVIFPSTQSTRKKNSPSATVDSNSARVNKNIVLKVTGSIGNGLDAV